MKRPTPTIYRTIPIKRVEIGNSWYDLALIEDLCLAREEHLEFEGHAGILSNPTTAPALEKLEGEGFASKREGGDWYATKALEDLMDCD
jgi:hypothetical protein